MCCAVEPAMMRDDAATAATAATATEAAPEKKKPGRKSKIQLVVKEQ
jgi:hypothetical protein